MCLYPTVMRDLSEVQKMDQEEDRALALPGNPMAGDGVMIRPIQSREKEEALQRHMMKHLGTGAQG